MNFLRKKLDDLKRPFGKVKNGERYAQAVNADTFLLFQTTLLILELIFEMRLISKEQW